MIDAIEAGDSQAHGRTDRRTLGTVARFNRILRQTRSARLRHGGGECLNQDQSMKFEGIYTPVITPYRDDYSIDYDRLAEIVDFLIDAGVHGIISAGTTGEYYAQTMEERFDLMKFIKKRSKRTPRSSSAPARCAPRIRSSTPAPRSRLGADALLVATPPYSLPTERENALHALAIDRAANLPIMLYNYPGPHGFAHGRGVSRPGRAFAEFLRDQGKLGRRQPHPPAGARLSAYPAVLRHGRPGARVFRLGRALLGLRRLQFRAGNSRRAVPGLRASRAISTRAAKSCRR